MTAAPAVLLDGLTVTYPARRGVVPVIAATGVSLSVAPGEFVAIIGPSGCGKSTLFGVLAGLIVPVAGEARVHGASTVGVSGLVGLMPQRDALLPWRTVIENVALGAEVAGGRTAARAARDEARARLPQFGLEGFADAYPATLSGGMRQRAAFLRTVLTGRDVLLLDEPFGALDALTRADLQAWLLERWMRERQTVLFVTHDVDEAVFLADRVAVLTPRPGRVRAEIAVPLPRPRSHVALAADPRAAALRAAVLAALAGESETGDEPQRHEGTKGD